jgi:hypothetical protein
MEENQGPSPLDQKQASLFVATMNLNQRARAGANNFYWIAGLSVVNSFISAFGGGINFVIGLGLTQVVDAFARVFADEAREAALLFTLVGLVLSILVAGIFAIFGVFAVKQLRWAFIAGMLLYGLDAALLLAFQDWIGFFFHLYFLWGLWNGLQALIQLQKLSPSGQVISGFPRDIGQ